MLLAVCLYLFFIHVSCFFSLSLSLSVSVSVSLSLSLSVSLCVSLCLSVSLCVSLSLSISLYLSLSLSLSLSIFLSFSHSLSLSLSAPLCGGSYSSVTEERHRETETQGFWKILGRDLGLKKAIFNKKFLLNMALLELLTPLSRNFGVDKAKVGTNS